MTIEALAIPISDLPEIDGFSEEFRMPRLMPHRATAECPNGLERRAGGIEGATRTVLSDRRHCIGSDEIDRRKATR